MKTQYIAMAIVVLVASSGDLSSECQLFRIFPGDFDQDSADIDRLTVVTISNSQEFLKLLMLEVQWSDDSWQRSQVGDRQLRMQWCEYVGFNAEYHYAYSLVDPREVYRIKRVLVNDEDIVRTLKRRVELDKVLHAANVGLPTVALSVESFASPSMIGPVDDRLVKQAGKERFPGITRPGVSADSRGRNAGDSSQDRKK